MDLAVFDVDGVLADVSHRRHHLRGGRRDWAAFFAAAAGDGVLAPGLAMVQRAAEPPLVARVVLADWQPGGARRVLRRAQQVDGRT